MSAGFGIAVLVLFLVLASAGNANGEYRSRYIASLRYPSLELLREFNDNVRLPRQLSYMARRKNPATIAEEVLAKLDIIIEKVEVVLDMFPEDLRITVMLLEDAAAVSREYRRNYGKTVNHIAYYSLSRDTVYYSIDDATLRVVAHEFGHAVVDHFFEVRPPYSMHELMAQFAEKHVTD